MARVRGLTIESSNKTTGKTSQRELNCSPRTELSKLHSAVRVSEVIGEGKLHDREHMAKCEFSIIDTSTR